jgi:FAD-dependent monooxygenase
LPGFYTMKEHILPSNEVLIVGAGPVGMVTAVVLAFYGLKSTVLERNDTTTKWPKMDLTNVRSMEIFRKLGLADSLRKQGICSQSYKLKFQIF